MLIILKLLLLLIELLLVSSQTGYDEVVGTGKGIPSGFKADGITLYKGGSGESTIIITMQREDVFGYYNIHLYYPMKKCSKVNNNPNNIDINGPVKRIGQDEIIVTIEGSSIQTVAFDMHNCQLYNGHFGIRDGGDYSVSVIRLVGEGDLLAPSSNSYKPLLFFTKTVHLEGSQKSIANKNRCDYSWTIIKSTDSNDENSIPSQCKDTTSSIFWTSPCENVTRTDSVFGSNRGIGLRLTIGQKIKIKLIGDNSMNYIGEQVRNR
jgi:hypothetical protein